MEVSCTHHPKRAVEGAFWGLTQVLCPLYLGGTWSKGRQKHCITGFFNIYLKHQKSERSLIYLLEVVVGSWIPQGPPHTSRTPLLGKISAISSCYSSSSFSSSSPPQPSPVLPLTCSPNSSGSFFAIRGQHPQFVLVTSNVVPSQPSGKLLLSYCIHVIPPDTINILPETTHYLVFLLSFPTTTNEPWSQCCDCASLHAGDAKLPC